MTTPSIISNTASNHPTIPVTNTTMCTPTKSSPPRSSNANANANATANANASANANANATASATANANANETQQQRPRLVRFADDPSQRSAWTSVSSQLSSSADPPKAVRRKSSLTVEGAKLVQALHHCLEDCVFDDDNDNDDDDDDDETTQEATAIAAASTGAVATAVRHRNGNSDTRTIRISLQSATDDDDDDEEEEEEEHETSFPSQRGAWMDQSDSSLHRPPKAAQRKKSLSAEALALVETIFAVVSDREITKKYAETAEDNENNEDNENKNNDRVTNNNIEAQPAPQEDNALPDSSQRIARTSQSESLCPPLCAERNQSLSNDVKNFVEAFVSAMEEDCNDEVDDDDDEVDDDDDDDDDDETDTIVHNATATAPAIYAADAASTEGQTPTRYRYTRIADEPTRSKSLCPPSGVERRQSLSKGVKTFMEALVSAMEEDSEEGDDDEDNDDDDDDNDDGDDRFENTTTPTDASPTRVDESMEEQNGGADKDADKDAKRKLPKRTIRFRDDPSQRGAWTSQSRSLCPPAAVERKQSLASEAMNVDAAAAAAANDGTPSRTNRRNAHAHAHARNSLSRSDAQNLIEALVSAMGDLSQREEEEEDAIIMHPSQSSSSMGSSSSNNSRTAWVNPEMRTSERSLRPPSPPERKETLENEAFSSLVGHAESSSL